MNKTTEVAWVQRGLKGNNDKAGHAVAAKVGRFGSAVLSVMLLMATMVLPAQAELIDPPPALPAEVAHAGLVQAYMGYHPLAPKKVVVTGYAGDKAAKITLFDTKAPGFLPGMVGKTVYKDPSVRSIAWRTTGAGPSRPALEVDFTGFEAQGTYELRVNNVPVGQPITISEFGFWDAMVPSLQSLYLSRSGSSVDFQSANIERPASHRKDAYVETYLASGRQTLYRNVVGGWYNGSNDYAKYSVTTAFTVGTWLNVFMQSPEPWKTFKMGYGFGESSLSDVRDMLHEMKHGINWLLSMQRSDGQVYHQVNGLNPPGDVRPEDDDQTRYLSGLYAQDTAAATAAFALASVAYQKSDVGYSVKTLMAAQKGWKALQKLPVRPVSAATQARVPYLADSDVPHRLWAAMALYYATGEKQFLTAATQLQTQFKAAPLSWQNPGVLVALQHDVMSHISVPPAILLAVVPPARIREAYSALSAWQKSAPYGVFPQGQMTPTTGNQPEGPNIAVLDALTLLLAQPKLNESVLMVGSQAVNGVMGLNQYQRAFVSGTGAGMVQHPGALLGNTLRKPLPGLLIAGPKANAPYVDGWLQPANATDLATTARWGWVLARLNWGYTQLEQQRAADAPPPTYRVR